MNATMSLASAEPKSTGFLAVAAAREERSAILGALAIAGVWILVIATVLFGILAPLNASFAACNNVSPEQIASRPVATNICPS